VRTPDGVLYLYNQPGRLLRIRPARSGDAPVAGDAPFVLDATFTQRMPNDPAPDRIWVDPAGRIVFACQRNRLSILFPAGHIPHAILTLMPAEQQEDPGP
jgi:hypothetical protein